MEGEALLQKTKISSRKGANILVSEDNPVNAKLIRLMLEGLGCRITTVLNGRAAIEKIKNSRYDLILMDCQMPELDGFETTRIIRNEMSKDCPIIGISAAAVKENREKALAGGMNDYITKPIDINVLKEKLAIWLR